MTADDDLLECVYAAMVEYVNIYPTNLAPPHHCLFCNRVVNTMVWDYDFGLDLYKRPEEVHAKDCPFILVAHRLGKTTDIPPT